MPKYIYIHVYSAHTIYSATITNWQLSVKPTSFRHQCDGGLFVFAADKKYL